MKIVLQHVHSKRYSCGGDLGKPRSDTGFDFQHAGWSRGFVATHHLQKVQMVVSYLRWWEAEWFKEWQRLAGHRS